MRASPALALCLLALSLPLNGCARDPAVAAERGRVPEGWPELVPLDPVLAQADSLGAATDPQPEVAAQGAALRARAAALRNAQ